MNNNIPVPGVSRHNRISDEGLQRLEKQLASNLKISKVVLAQWIKRYGDPARNLIKKYACYTGDMG
ncbi:MAG: hypothetical protein OEY43_06720 [Gammaproteobacteria bacterium]|nr:hypothetical protein [Gammaproteobacteria bacterium]